MQPNYTKIGSVCNLWRNFDDIQDSWESVVSIIDYYGDNQEELIPAAGPGHWNDPDMVILFPSLSQRTLRIDLNVKNIKIITCCCLPNFTEIELNSR